MLNGKNKRAPSLPNESRVESELSSGNVFADLGLPNPDLAIVKAELASSANSHFDCETTAHSSKSRRVAWVRPAQGICPAEGERDWLQH